MEMLQSLLIEVSNSDVLLRQLVVWLSALTVFVLVLGGATVAVGYFDPVRRRVGTVANAPRKKNKDSIVASVATSIGPVGAFVLPQDELERSKVMMKLHHAGFRTSTALQAFYLIKTVAILVLPLIVLVASTWLPESGTGDVMLYAVIAAGAGLVIPNFVLERLIMRRKRAISNGFPDALDLLVVCVESGLGLAAAIQRVSDELGVSHPELGFELETVNAEIRVGVPREKALKNLADRTGLDDIRGLVGLLVQTMRFGTGVADALRVYSEEFRDKRMQKAEEQAAKMGTKLVFPLVLFMFPIFFIVAIGPAVLRVIDAFGMT